MLKNCAEMFGAILCFASGDRLPHSQ